MDNKHAYHISPDGNLVTRPLGAPLKSGWRHATEVDYKHALEVEAKRAAKEAKEQAEAVKAARAAQDKADADDEKTGGPVKAK